MPATTANRGYPYPLDSDLIDVTLDIRRLAEAIDGDMTTVTATDVLDIRPWTGGAQFGSLVHPAMYANEYCLISTPGAPTYLSAFTDHGVVICNGANDQAHSFSVGPDFRFTGGSVLHMTPGGHFLTAPLSDAQFGDHNGSCHYRPHDAGGHSSLVNLVGGHIYHNAWAHHFSNANQTAEALVVQPNDNRIEVRDALYFPRGDSGWYMDDTAALKTLNNKPVYVGGPSIVSADTEANLWWNQQLRIEAPIGIGGISITLRGPAWGIVMRGNPGSTFAPCLDVMNADTGTYIPIVAGAYQDLSSVRYKSDVRPVTDTDLLRRVDQVSAVTWLQNKPTDLDGATMSSPYLDSRRMGVTAEAMVTPFPELVGLDDQGDPLSVDAGKLAATALASVGALSRKVNTLVTQVTALETRIK